MRHPAGARGIVSLATRIITFHLYGELSTMARTVMCARLGQELPGLEKQPFPGELGQRIYENVSADAYAEWKEQLTNIINHYGLNPADAETRQMLRKEMEAFFFGKEETMQATDLTPDSVESTE